MFINATFPLWFCIIPLLGMVFMMVVMFFICRGGCGSGKDKSTLPTDNT